MSGRIDGSFILNPGLLRHGIVWQEKVVSGQDTTGADVYSWNDVLRCRARVQALGGREYARVMERWADAQYEITQHYSKGLKAKMRIQWLVDGDTHTLDVLNINDPAGAGRYQTVICKDHEDQAIG